MTKRSRRQALGAFALVLATPGLAFGFGPSGSFHARLLATGGRSLTGMRESGLKRWAWELVRRTSAPARLSATVVAADRPELLEEPFVVWAGDGDVPALTAAEIRGLRRYLTLGGTLVVDDTKPEDGAFGRAARRELKRVLPESTPVKLDPTHVVFKTYYILDRPVGRVLGPPQLEAIVRGKTAQVLLLSHDLLGALARRDGGAWAAAVEPGGETQRQMAIRLAVNIAMYVLCSDYKDDQVHAPWLMRRRASRRQ